MSLWKGTDYATVIVLTKRGSAWYLAFTTYETPGDFNGGLLAITWVNNPLPVDNLWHEVQIIWDTSGGSPVVKAWVDRVQLINPPMNPPPNPGPVNFQWGPYGVPTGLGGNYSFFSSPNAPLSGSLPHVPGDSQSVYPQAYLFNEVHDPEVGYSNGSYTFPTTHNGGKIKSYNMSLSTTFGLAGGATVTESATVAGKVYSQTVGGGGQISIFSGNAVPRQIGFTAGLPTYQVNNSPGINYTNISASQYAIIANYDAGYLPIPFNTDYTGCQAWVGADPIVGAGVPGALAELYLLVSPGSYPANFPAALSNFSYLDGSAVRIGGTGWLALGTPPQIYCSGDIDSFTLGLPQQTVIVPKLGTSGTFSTVWTVLGTLIAATSDPYSPGIV
jgi:hypothetical protein